MTSVIIYLLLYSNVFFQPLIRRLNIPLTDAQLRAKAEKKFDDNTTAGAGDLQTGIKAAQADWKANTSAAVENYTLGIQEAISNNSFQKGVDRTDPNKFGNSITSASKQKYIQNTTAAKGKVGDTAVRNRRISNDALSSLRPRGRAGDPANLERMNRNAQALHDEKVARIASGG